MVLDASWLCWSVICVYVYTYICHLFIIKLLDRYIRLFDIFFRENKKEHSRRFYTHTHIHPFWYNFLFSIYQLFSNSVLLERETTLDKVFSNHIENDTLLVQSLHFYSVPFHLFLRLLKQKKKKNQKESKIIFQPTHEKKKMMQNAKLKHY